MPAKVDDSPLGISFEFPRAKTWRTQLAGLPNETAARELALSLANLVHPHGTIASEDTAVGYCVTLRKFVRFLASNGFSGSLSGLGSPLLLRFWLAHKDYEETHVRRMLGAFDEHIGRLKDDVRDQVNGRPRKTSPKASPLRPYTETEWSRLRECCTKIVDDAWRAHRKWKLEGERADDPRTVGVNGPSLAWMLLNHGPMTQTEAFEWIGSSRWGHFSEQRCRTSNGTFHQVRDALFPNHELHLAYRLLFGIHTGIVADGIDDLGLDGIDWAGSHVAVVKYVKGRTGPEGLNLSPPASRLLVKWLEHSALLRAATPPAHRDTLWLVASRRSTNCRRSYFDTSRRASINREFVAKYSLVTDDGTPLHLHRNRIRTTYLSLLSRKGWTGRTPIDPNHSTAVEGDNYLTVTTPAQQEAIDAIIAASQSDLIRKALTPKVFSEADIETAAAAMLQLITADNRANLSTAELLDGSHDVFVASCLDYMAGQWGPVGHPCPARPWVCLLCPLAVFMPRHATNLLRLQAFFARQFRAMTVDAYLRIFGPYAQRLESDILPRFDADVLTAAARDVSDRDDELPIRPEERSL